MPCLGSHGALFVRSGAGLNKPGTVATGTDRNTVQGTVGPSFAAGTLTSTVQSADLLGGIVQATVIRATARMTKVGSAIRLADPGSSFATLTVKGFPSIGANVPANTHVNLPGVGTLYLHRVIVKPRSIEVRMIELVVTHANAYGLAVGTDLRVAVAHGTIR
jgi:hypothetical protein